VQANRGVMAHDRPAVKALEAYKVMKDTQTESTSILYRCSMFVVVKQRHLVLI